MLNSTINKVIEYSLDEYFIDRDSLKIFFDDITTNEMIINLSALKLSEICYNIIDIIKNLSGVDVIKTRIEDMEVIEIIV
jgi:hypothetical protein